MCHGASDTDCTTSSIRNKGDNVQLGLNIATLNQMEHFVSNSALLRWSKYPVKSSIGWNIPHQPQQHFLALRTDRLCEWSEKSAASLPGTQMVPCQRVEEQR